MLHYYVNIELIAHTIHEYQTTLPKIIFAYDEVTKNLLVIPYIFTLNSQ